MSTSKKTPLSTLRSQLEGFDAMLSREDLDESARAFVQGERDKTAEQIASRARSRRGKVMSDDIAELMTLMGTSAPAQLIKPKIHRITDLRIGDATGRPFAAMLGGIVDAIKLVDPDRYDSQNEYDAAICKMIRAATDKILHQTIGVRLNNDGITCAIPVSSFDAS